MGELAADSPDNPALVLGAALAANAGRDKVVDRRPRLRHRRLRRLGRAADRRVHRQARHGRAAGRGRGRDAPEVRWPASRRRRRRAGCARRAGRRRPARRAVGVTVSGTLGAQLLLWETATAVAGAARASTRSTSPTSRARRRPRAACSTQQPEPDGRRDVTEGGIEVRGSERPARRRRLARGRRRRAAGPARRRRLPGGHGLPRLASATPPCTASGPTLAARTEPTDDLRLGAAVPALDRPVPQGRPPQGVFLQITCRRADRRRDPRPPVHVRHADRGPGGRRRGRARRPRPAGPAAAPDRPGDRRAAPCWTCLR